MRWVGLQFSDCAALSWVGREKLASELRESAKSI